MQNIKNRSHDFDYQCSIGCTICGNDTPLHAHRSTFAARRIYRAPLSDTNETSFNYSYIVLQSKPSLPSDCSLMHRDDCRFSVRQTCFIYAKKYIAMRRIDIFSFLRSTSLIPFRPRKSYHLSTSSIYLPP